MQGVDYAWGRPGGAALKAAGVHFAMRYLSTDIGKNLSRAEALDLAGHGVSVGVVWETTAQRALDGHAAGQSDAASALAQAHACGMPTGRPIYAAVDFDASGAQQSEINDYFRGWNTVIPPAQTGIYGGFWSVSRTMSAGLARYGWQTTAWSHGDWYAAAHLQQRGGNVEIGGVDCDWNTATGDVGLWTPGGTPVPPVPPAPPAAPTYTVKSGDTMTGIAAHLGVTLAELEHANPQVTDPDVIHVGQVLHVPGHVAPSAKTYTVEEGDTLSAIAARRGITLGALELANPQIHNPNLIVPGQVIYLP